MSEVGSVVALTGKVFLEQRLLPYRLARLSGDAILPNGKQISAGTYLFIVYQQDGRAAYCTIKDQSGGNVSKSLFIPALDKRPCLVDADKDGKFESSFGVFDKYGSALTPSGNLSSAKPIAAPVSYNIVEPAEFPVVRKFSFTLTGSELAKARIEVQYDNGTGYVPLENRVKDPVAGSPEALNLRADIETLQSNQAKMNLTIDPNRFVVGDSGGSFVTAFIPEFVN
jgi:hypothetical protein